MLYIGVALLSHILFLYLCNVNLISENAYYLDLLKFMQ